MRRTPEAASSPLYTSLAPPRFFTYTQDKTHADETLPVAFGQGYSYSMAAPTQSQQMFLSSAMLSDGSPRQTAHARPGKLYGRGMTLERQCRKFASAAPSAPSAPPACDQIASSPTPQYECPPVTRAMMNLTSPGQSASVPRPALAQRRIGGKTGHSAGSGGTQQSDMGILASDVKAAPLPRTNENKLHELTSLQKFDGSWMWTQTLFAVLELEEELVKATLPGLEETMMATLLAVAFLEGKMSEDEGVWEMVVEKAKWWLEGKIGESRYIDDLAKVKKNILGVA